MMAIKPFDVEAVFGNPLSVSEMLAKGGAGSGNFGHEGRPGERGGSGGGGGKTEVSVSRAYYKGGVAVRSYHVKDASGKETIIQHMAGPLNSHSVHEYEKDGERHIRTLLSRGNESKAKAALSARVGEKNYKTIKSPLD
jgi:hypothetical protein